MLKHQETGVGEIGGREERKRGQGAGLPRRNPTPPCSSLIGGGDRPGGWVCLGRRVRARSPALEDRKGGGAAAARAPGTRAAQAARIAGSRSGAEAGSLVCVRNGAPGRRSR